MSNNPGPRAPTPYYQDETVTLYHGRFEDVLPTLNITADLIVTDPPYGETSLAWDTWPKGWPTLAAQHARSMWCFGSMRMFLTQRDEFSDWRLSQDIVWAKPRGSSTTADRFSRSHEHALYWYRGNWSEIHHDPPRIAYHGPPVSVPRGASRPNDGGRVRESMVARTPYVEIGTRLMLSVIPGKAGDPRHILNPTQKPLTVLEPLIHYGCPVGGLVLDLFAGSASTLVAARNTGRRAIGIEAREDQCEQAANRLSQGILFGQVTP